MEVISNGTNGRDNVGGRTVDYEDDGLGFGLGLGLGDVGLEAANGFHMADRCPFVDLATQAA